MEKFGSGICDKHPGSATLVEGGVAMASEPPLREWSVQLFFTSYHFIFVLSSIIVARKFRLPFIDFSCCSSTSTSRESCSNLPLGERKFSLLPLFARRGWSFVFIQSLRSLFI
jgi:hypothetical protein